MSIAKDVIDLYRTHRRLIILCESITAGGIACALAQVPHTSEVLWASLVLYQSQAKNQLLQIDPHLLSPDCIASPATVEAMAKATASLYLQTQKNPQPFVTLAISGFADGDKAGSISCALYHNDKVTIRQWQLTGRRVEIQQEAVTLSLHFLLEQD